MRLLTQLRSALRPAPRWFQRRPKSGSLGEGYEVTTPEKGFSGPAAWLDATVAQRQLEAFRPHLEALRLGKPRQDFAALADSIRTTGLESPLILEVGCASGWNAEVLALLLHRPVRYFGLDYSPAMISLGRQQYPSCPFVVGDAAALPFCDQACDILLSGTVLMHLLQYDQAIRESRRVTRRWCIFHTVPVLQHRATTFLRKGAYGGPVGEVVFNEQHLCEQFAQAGLVVRSVLPSLPYDLEAVLGEPTLTKTFVCQTLP